MKRWMILLMVFCLAGSCVSGFDYVIGYDSYANPTISVPVKGEVIIDPNFNINITRVTDRTLDGHGMSFVNTFYSTAPTSNVDNSYIFMVGGQVIYLYHGPNSITPYQYIGNFDTTSTITTKRVIGNTWDQVRPYWSATDPDLFYWLPRPPWQTDGTRLPALYSYRISNDTVTLIHDFSQDPELAMFLNNTPKDHIVANEEYSEPSRDRRYWAFWVKESSDPMVIKAAFVYDMIADDITGALYSGVDDICCRFSTTNTKGETSPSADGDYVLIRNNVLSTDSGAQSTLSRANIWDINLTTIIGQVPPADHHHDWAKDVNGEDVIFFIDAQTSPVGPSIWYPETNYLYKLFLMYGPSGSHYSGHCYSTPGWGLMEVNDNDENGHWSANQLFMVELDPTKTLWRMNGSDVGTKVIYRANDNPAVLLWRIAHTHGYWYSQTNGWGDSYRYQSKATISEDGKYVWWGSEWDGSHDHYVEVYQVEFPDNWWKDLSNLQSPNSPYNIKVSAYNFEDTEIPLIASSIDLLNTGLSKATQVQQIKDQNPNIITIHYDNTQTHQTGATEDWYVHDEVTGQRLYHKDWGWYLMNISNPDYRTSLANYIDNNLDNNLMFDGVMLDDTWNSMDPNYFYRDGTTTQGVIPQSYIDNFHSDMITLLTEIKITIGSKLLIPNTGYYATDYLAISDGQTDESFCHANWQSFSEWFSDPSWRNHLNAMIAASDSGKIYSAQSGILDGATPAEINQTQRYCYAIYLLGAGNNTYFHFIPRMLYQNVTYFPEWDIDIGDPIEDYHAVAGTNLYQREYEDGLVLINPSGPFNQYDLGGNYLDLDGNTISSVTLDIHEGTILQEVTSTYHDADLDHSGDINKTEIDNYVQKWKGDMTISLFDIIDAIGKWKQGSY
ncbi:MAG: hypothetical protein ABIB79_00780 [archaeon]